MIIGLLILLESIGLNHRYQSQSSILLFSKITVQYNISTTILNIIYLRVQL